MSEHEPVTSPDQIRPGFRKSATIGAIVTIVALVAMALIRNKDTAADIWLLGTAGLIALLLIGDWALRRNGLRS